MDGKEANKERIAEQHTMDYPKRNMYTMNYPHIVHTEGTCGGRPRIEGTRIEVANIAAAIKQGVALEEIADYYPSVLPAQLLAAAAYYHDNRAEIEAILHLQHNLYEAGFAAQQQHKKEKIAV